MKKLTFALTLVAMVAIIGTVSAKEYRYSDVTEDLWCYHEVETTSELGIFHGYADGTFLPRETVSESEALTAFFNASKYFAFGQIDAGKDTGAWYSKAVNGMQNVGLLNWRFSADRGMLREHVAFVAAAYLNYSANNELVAKAVALYSDIDGLTHEQMSAIGACAEEGVMIGKVPGTFGTGDLTRGELAAVIYRMLVARGIVSGNDSIVIEDPQVPSSDRPSDDTPDTPVVPVIPEIPSTVTTTVGASGIGETQTIEADTILGDVFTEAPLETFVPEGKADGEEFSLENVIVITNNPGKVVSEITETTETTETFVPAVIETTETAVAVTGIPSYDEVSLAVVEIIPTTSVVEI